MFWKKKSNYYCLHLDYNIDKVKEGDFKYLPMIFDVFSENSDKHKKIAASFLNEFLNKCSCDDIYEIDKQMRETTYMEWRINWNLFSVENFITKQMSNDEKYAVLAFASFNSNGYIREKAIKDLVQYKRAMSFILLRCNDWVDEVRYLALKLLPQILNVSSNEEIIYAIPLLEKLRRGEKCDYDNILRILVSSIHDNKKLIKSCLNSNNVKIRKFAITELNALNILNNDDLMRYFLKENNLFLRKIAYETVLKNKINNIDILHLTKHFLRDKLPQNRILALQYSYDNDVSNVTDITMDMIMDKNSNVRMLARSIIELKNIDVDVRQIYIDNISLKTAISIYGLGEIGTLNDCMLIEKYLQNNHIFIVRAAMTSLMRLNSEKYSSCITDMLAIDKSAIVKTATILLKKNKTYDFEKIFEIQSQSLSENTKIKCESLLILSSKWKKLIYMLELIGSGFENLEILCQTHINNWIFNYNRSYIIPNEDEKRIILDLLNRKSQFLKDETVKEIIFLMK